MEKPEKYSYYNNKKSKIPYKEWPQECKDYKNYIRLIRKHPEWKQLNDEQIKIEQRKLKLETLEKNRNIKYEKEKVRTPEEKAIINKKKGNYYNKSSEEKKAEIREQLRQISQKFWDGMNDEKRKEFGKYRWNLKTDEEKEIIIKRFIEGSNKYMESLSPEEIKYQIENMNKARLDKLNSDEKFRLEQFTLLNKHMHEYWDNISDDKINEIKDRLRKRYENLSDEEKLKISKCTFDRNRKWWDSRTPDQLKEISERMVKWNGEYWSNPENIKKHSDYGKYRWTNMNEEDKQKIINKFINYWNLLPIEEKKILKKKQLISSIGNNNFHKKFENAFNESHLVNNYYFKPEEVLSNENNIHSWDYGIYDKSNNELVMVVDLDGSYFHADNNDYDGYHSKEEYDECRSLSIPINSNIKHFIIQELNFSKCFELMLKTLIMNYDEYVDNIFKMCRSMPFPSPRYTDIELIKSYKDLVKMKTNDKYHQDISLNTRVGDRLIQHFHPSIYRANRKGKISPYDAWYNDEMLLKVIKNRIIYQNYLNPNKILQGFNISKVAQKVSVFSAGRAKMLINKYLSDCNEIFDPFSGFSGRMLGAISLDKKYIGQDISEIHVNESNKIIDFLNNNGFNIDANINQCNILNSTGEYECLFTCPPYSDKEQWLEVPVNSRSCDDWINECLKRFKCKKYLFVVDDTKSYQEYIVDEIVNKSHLNKNNEYVILIERT